MKQPRKPTRRTLSFALAAMVASLLLAVLNLFAFGSGSSRFVAAGGFAAAALLWWIVFVRWKRVLDASS